MRTCLPFTLPASFSLLLHLVLCHRGGPLPRAPWPLRLVDGSPSQREKGQAVAQGWLAPRDGGLCLPMRPPSRLLRPLPFLHCPSGSPIPVHSSVINVFLNKYPSNYPNAGPLLPLGHWSRVTSKRRSKLEPLSCLYRLIQRDPEVEREEPGVS